MRKIYNHLLYDDLSGMKFGEWTVLRQYPSAEGLDYWICKCSCGIEQAVCRKDLLSSTVTDCGCKSGYYYGEKREEKDRKRKAPASPRPILRWRNYGLSYQTRVMNKPYASAGSFIVKKRICGKMFYIGRFSTKAEALSEYDRVFSYFDEQVREYKEYYSSIFKKDKVWCDQHHIDFDIKSSVNEKGEIVLTPIFKPTLDDLKQVLK